MEAAVARECMVSVGIFVDRHQRVRADPAFDERVDLRLHPTIFHRHMQQERAVEVRRFLDFW